MNSELQSWSHLADFFERSKIQSVLLVTGTNLYTASGADKKLVHLLEGKRVRKIDGLQINPQADEVVGLLQGLQTDPPYDAILAIGGGSVIDVAKLLKAFWHHPELLLPGLHHSDSLHPANIPLIAIPTTAGSGSEATHFAVVYHNKEKHSIAHPDLLPDLAIIDSELLHSLPQHIAAASGMDALCQGIESYWSIHSTEASRSLAKEAIQLAWSSLKPAVLDKDPDALEQLARASHLAGQAINLTKTTAPHAVSYALTSYFGLQHGHAVGLLTPAFLKFNAEVTDADCLDPRGAAWVKQSIHEIVDLLGYQTVAQAANGITQLIHDLGLETDFSKLGIQSESDIQLILDNGFNPGRVNNNPRKVTKEALGE
ncbi:phosphonoacetaldehyde reductase [Verrucomicrobiaceae bacterium N1E253]|uniref:Phosphonoacetaldehyde reductase n=1 Tax=Oceaniferula marina TaxID=2748318 RepID=A0A851GDA8_9BACT|nr:phosphonoacetaldehyde reductase [Oceaniferula marina]NWK55159.1 phosphonoacetaldehyde reductase [Oceaniferula marina]